MLETVRCPSCSSRYGLGPQRVKPGIRRARCFRCKDIFGIEAEVQRLLVASAPLDVAFNPMDFPDLEPLVEESLPELTSVEEPQAPVIAESIAPEPPPSLTLGDLEGTEEEILEKTLVVNPPATPEPPADLSTLPGTSTGSYASAKDAISRLLGEAPRPEAPVERRPTTHGANQMDVEAALDALDSTLGGSPRDLGTKPVTQPAMFREPKPEPPLNSTVKLSHEELMAAMSAAAMPPPEPPVVVKPIPPPAPPVVPPAPLPPSKPAVAAAPMPPAGPPPAAPISGTEAKAADSSLYKIQLPKETQNNVTLDVITAWIEQGRVQEYHMVARQQSEHWIEAGKVPALRMVFDRIKRAQASVVQQSQATLVPPPPQEPAPAKKSLFGGLFNRG